MKTVREYEGSDIDLKGNDMHRFLAEVVAFSAIALPLAANRHSSAEDALAEVVANILTVAERSGVSITRGEVPAVFRKAFDAKMDA